MSLPYQKNTWVDRNVQFPSQYDFVWTGAQTLLFTANPGTITQAGTQITAARMNNIEDGIVYAFATIDDTASSISLGGIF